jgi:hypothetical protein
MSISEMARKIVSTEQPGSEWRRSYVRQPECFQVRDGIEVRVAVGEDEIGGECGAGDERVGQGKAAGA